MAAIAGGAIPGMSYAQGNPAVGLPLWELGIGAGFSYGPDYPAAAQNSLNGLPFPVIIYRGDIFRTGDGELIRGQFIDTRRLEFSIGADGAFPADSDENDARDGMPDLDYLVELGPRANFYLLPRQRGHELSVDVQVRGVFSTDFTSVGYEGIVVNPGLLYRNRRLLGSTKVDFSASLGALWGYDGLNDYFYQVRPRFARDDRPAFDADNGYIGSELDFRLRYRLTSSLRLLVGLRLGYFDGSANQDSPLHRENFNVAAGMGLTWSIRQSEEQVGGSR
ncbi:MAG: MipA/OmpV family protein [Candidatus Competibacterales bacterium]